MLSFLGTTKQMAVLNLNDVAHVPSGLCFLTSPLLFQSSVINLKKSSRTLGGGAEVIEHRSKVERGCFSCVFYFLHIVHFNRSWLWMLKRNASCIIMFFIPSWHKVEKVKRWQKVAHWMLIILAQWWFPQTTIQWKWMGEKVALPFSAI